jgi:uncharacterized protein (DUF2235 family)
MQRSKFPYTARPSAKVIRHAVSIDERRAKFRQDLISGSKTQKEDKMTGSSNQNEPEKTNPPVATNHQRRENSQATDSSSFPPINHDPTTAKSSGHSAVRGKDSPKLLQSLFDKSSPQKPKGYPRRRYSDTTRPQDIKEVWFAGGHADIGGGWQKCEGESWPLSHAPLVWMIHEAERAGLKFDAMYAVFLKGDLLFESR